MMRSATFIFCITTFLMINSVLSSKTSLHPGTLKWLIGTWKLDDEKSITIERWQEINVNNFEGESTTVEKVAQDTTTFESLRIVNMDGEVFYLAKVAHNEFPIAFKLMNLTERKLIFENKSHDFPQKIIYEFCDENKLKATIEGRFKKTGEIKSIDFLFQKVE